ncbi:Pol Polyprotein [Phytophthora megakarya]|uniref:Pol Polyprotein n=1 Tax=Phytophthora megakarya TaxID=4795 RepID=A0A225UVL0_9STRA|nr:Pol Polyprotein [Phytophthora megakarya]
MAEFAINNAVHASTGHTPFFLNAMRHPPLLSTLGAVASSLRGGGSTVALEQPQRTADTDLSATTTLPGTDTVKNHEQATPASTKDNVSVRDTDTAKTHARAGPVARKSDVSIPGIDTEKLHAQAGPVAITHEVSVPGTDATKSHAQSGTDANTSGGSVQGTDADKTNELDPEQKLNADNVGRGNTNEFKIGPFFLLSTQNLPTHAVSGFEASKLAPRFIEPFTVAERHGSAYTLELPSDMRLHPTFYTIRAARVI